MEQVHCLECGAIEVPRIEERVETYVVRNEPIEVLAKVAVCTRCGADLSVEELDDQTLRTAFNTYRERHGIMRPESMVKLRSRYGLGVRAFSLLLGWGEITMHRYESGSLQDAAHEAQLRLADEPANIRILLEANGHKLTARQRARLERALQVEAAQQAEVHAGGYPDQFIAREEQDAYGGYRMLEVSKLREMMLWFSRLPDMFPTKLNKLLFYADFRHFKEHSVSISGSPYLAMQRGPVPEHYDWIKADLIEGGDLAAEEVGFPSGASGEVLSPLREVDDTLFSAEELTTMRGVAERMGGMTSTALSELSHRESAWRETLAGTRISYERAAELMG